MVGNVEKGIKERSGASWGVWAGGTERDGD